MSTLVSRQTKQADISLPDPQLGMIGVRSDNICAGYDHSFPSLFVRQSDLTPTWSTKSVCHGAQSSFPVKTSNHSNPEIHHSEQDCLLSDKTTYKSIDQTVHEQNKLERMEESRPGSPATGQSACSSLGNAVGNNIGSGAYGSNCTSNDGDATLAVASEITTASESLNGSGRYIHEGLGVADSLRSSQREAALTKFRLKRKDRCFEKKVLSSSLNFAIILDACWHLRLDTTHVYGKVWFNSICNYSCSTLGFLLLLVEPSTNLDTSILHFRLNNSSDKPRFGNLQFLSC